MFMRLWSQQLLPYLDRQRLLSQHRECCALRGKGWGKKHSVVDYVFTHDPSWLVAYHRLVMDEMERRGYHPDRTWNDPCWRGATLGREEGGQMPILLMISTAMQRTRVALSIPNTMMITSQNVSAC